MTDNSGENEKKRRKDRGRGTWGEFLTRVTILRRSCCGMSPTEKTFKKELI